jgi:hypothetical protein
MAGCEDQMPMDLADSGNAVRQGRRVAPRVPTPIIDLWIVTNILTVNNTGSFTA